MLYYYKTQQEQLGYGNLIFFPLDKHLLNVKLTLCLRIAQNLGEETDRKTNNYI